MKVKYLFIVFFIITFVFVSKAQYTKIFDCTVTSDGYRPTGSLVSDGTFLYGMLNQGGISNKGVLFKIMPDGTGYTKLLDFNGVSNGYFPFGSLIYDGTFLYGTAYAGDVNNEGVLFKIKPDGTGFSKLLDFAGATNGSFPRGDLISDGIFLYGMTYEGGSNDMGTIFKIKPDGTNYAKLLDFAGSSNGSYPYGSLISDGTFFYGMTQSGGVADSGVVFKIKPDGTGYTKLLDFMGTSNGAFPQGSLVSDGTFLYGMTYKGGSTNSGTIFKIKPDGTGYGKLSDFTGAANGSFPKGALMYDGTNLYGMTANGGTGPCAAPPGTGCGTLFKIKPDGTGYTKLFDFTGSPDGVWPLGAVISDGTFLYGMTDGGASGIGTIFKYGLLTGITENQLQESISVYPNPASGIFNLKTGQENLKINELKVYNVLNQCVFQSANTVQEQSIDLSAQHNGIYFVWLKTDQGTVTKKLILNK